MAQNDHSDVYIIPPNFVKEGTLFSGRAEARNVVEAAFLALVGIRFLVFLNLGIKGKIYVGIILILPLVILAVIGVQGESLSSFLIQLFSYLVKRRVLTEPSSQYRLKRNRRIRKQQKKRCRRERKKRKKEGGRDRKRNRRAEEETEGGRNVRKRNLPVFRSVRMCRKKSFGKKKTDYRHKKKEGKLRSGSMNRKQKNAVFGKIWRCRLAKKLEKKNSLFQSMIQNQ